MRAARIAAVGLAVAALAASGCGGDDEESVATDTTTETTATTSGDPSALAGNVGPGFDISLTDSAGSDVMELSAGSYTIDVNDQSTIHNFHLTGPGVEESTEVTSEGTSTFQVDFEAGTYTFVCDPHAGQMTGSFEVTG